jgi:hypothetical protein
MKKPETLILSDGEYFVQAGTSAAIGFAILAFVLGIAVVFLDAPLADLVLPLAALSSFWIAWLGINLIIGFIHRSNDRRAINRLFQGEIWAQWQFDAAEWQQIIDAEYQSMVPEAGVGAYIGAIYSGIFGLVIATVLVVVGIFAIGDAQIMPIIWVSALAVFLLLVGVGLFQPIQRRRQAQRYQDKAIRFRDPHVWFSADGIYHETLGYTSLKHLEKVTDQTKSRQAITFTVLVTTVLGSGRHASPSTHSQPISFAVPSGLEKEAAQLVRRYRQERL